MSDKGMTLELPRAFSVSEPTCSGLIKSEPADFFVAEELGFDLSGDGEHVYLHIEKTDRNTRDVVLALAEACGVKPGDIGYSGLKDKRAVTRQWFSVCWPGQKTLPKLPAFSGMQLLEQARHSKKLRSGSHRQNFFSITLRQLQGDMQSLRENIAAVKQQGVPNYFGEQRFGIGGSNLADMDTFLKQAKGKQHRFKDRMRVSAMRAWLFNVVLAQRVQQQNWNRRLGGEPQDTPSGPLWGRGRPLATGELCELETAALQGYESWCEFLEHCGLQQERRPLCLYPIDFEVEHAGDQLQLQFSLPPGGFATVVLRELCRLTTVGNGEDRGNSS